MERARYARAQMISEIMNSMGAAPPAEVLLSLYWRENAAGRAAAAVPILRAAAELVPGEPDTVWPYLNTQVAGRPVAEQIAMRREFVQKFPT